MNVERYRTDSEVKSSVGQERSVFSATQTADRTCSSTSAASKPRRARFARLRKASW
jgi:hypothetical protein